MAKPSHKLAPFDPIIVRQAVAASFAKLDPRVQVRNPVRFIVEIGSLVTTAIWIRELIGQTGQLLFSGHVVFTVLFANFAEAIAEGRGKAQAATLRRRARKPSRTGCARAGRRKSCRRAACARVTR